MARCSSRRWKRRPTAARKSNKTQVLPLSEAELREWYRRLHREPLTLPCRRAVV